MNTEERVNIEEMTEKQKAEWAWEQAGKVTEAMFEPIRETINDEKVREHYDNLVKEERYDEVIEMLEVNDYLRNENS